MADSTPSTDPNTLFFPAFLYGDHATCRRKMKAEAKKSAKRYQKSADFLEPTLVHVPPGSVITVHDGAASRFTLGKGATTPEWYFYLVDMLRMETSLALTIPFEEELRFRIANEAFLCRYPWGALSLTIHDRLYTSIARVSQRLEAVLSFWEQLATVRYIDRYYIEELDLAKLLTFYTYDMMLTWADAPVGRSTREVLREMMERMRDASEDEIHARMMRRLHQMIDTDPELKHREWLKSPGLIETELAQAKKTEPNWYKDLTTGQSLSGLLSRLEEKYPGG